MAKHKINFSDFIERMKDMSSRQFKKELAPVFEKLGLNDYSYLFYKHFSPIDIVYILEILKDGKAQKSTRSH